MAFSARLLGGILFILLLQIGGSGLMAANPQDTTSSVLAASKTPAAETAADPFFKDFAIDQKVSKQRFKNLNVKLRNSSGKARLHPRTITITILGPPSASSKRAALKTEIVVYIDLAGSSPGIYVEPAKIRLPRGYVLIDAKPEIFVVEIKSGS